MDFAQASCTEFVTVLASNAPVPGGGGASALVGAIGTALGNMVGSLTVGKKKYADVEEEMVALKAKCDAIQADLLRLIAKDAEVFAPLAKAYGLPKETEEERAYKAKILEECTVAACSVPRHPAREAVMAAARIRLMILFFILSLLLIFSSPIKTFLVIFRFFVTFSPELY